VLSRRLGLFKDIAVALYCRGRVVFLDANEQGMHTNLTGFPQTELSRQLAPDPCKGLHPGREQVNFSGSFFFYCYCELRKGIDYCLVV
jgi:hypothetical protein